MASPALPRPQRKSGLLRNRGSFTGASGGRLVRAEGVYTFPHSRRARIVAFNELGFWYDDQIGSTHLVIPDGLTVAEVVRRAAPASGDDGLFPDDDTPTDLEV